MTRAISPWPSGPRSWRRCCAPASPHHATWLAGVMNDRTPVILPPDRIDAWLDPELTDKATVQRLIGGIEYEPLQVRIVSTAVNRPAAAPPADRN